MVNSMAIKEAPFEHQKLIVGMDVHVRSWKVSPILGDTPQKAFSMEPSPEQLAKSLKKKYPGAEMTVVYEAGCCGYWIKHRLEGLGLKCLVVHAADVPTTGRERAMKNDFRDSRKLARGLISRGLTIVFAPTEEELMDRALVRARYNIAKGSRRMKSRIKMHFHLFGEGLPGDREMKHWSRRFMTWLWDKQKERGDIALMLLLRQEELFRKEDLMAIRELRKLSRTERYRERVLLLLTVPGVGLLTAMLLLTELVDIGRFRTLDQICSYIGICPTTNSSGEKDRVGGMSKRGSKRLRSALIESAWTAIRYDPAMALAYNNCKERTSKSNKAIVKVTRKLINRIRYVLTNKVEYKKGLV